MQSLKMISFEEYSSKSNEEKISEIPRFCYRNGFENINGTKISSDRGWGCCYRSAQGIIAEWVLHLYKEKREIYNKTFSKIVQKEEKNEDEKENEIYEEVDPLSLFCDTHDAPFSIQKLVEAAGKVGVPPGEWAKPSTLAAAISIIFEDLGLKCIVSQDFSLNTDEISQIKEPTLLLIPGMFGLDKFDMNYMPFLQLCICAHGSLGFVSGKRNSAYYFFGFNSNSFAYFDPHVTKPAVTESKNMASFFELAPKLLKTEQINPSTLIGFYCNNAEHLTELLMVLTACFASPLIIHDAQELDKIVDQVLDIDDI